MNPLDALSSGELIGREFSLRLTSALVHVGWLGLLAGLSSGLVSVTLRRHSARLRYALNVAALVTLVACLPVAYFLVDCPWLEGPSVAVSRNPSAIAALRFATTRKS